MIVVEYKTVSVIAFFMANRANVVFARFGGYSKFFCGTTRIGKTFACGFCAILTFRSFKTVTVFVIWLTT